MKSGSLSKVIIGYEKEVYDDPQMLNMIDQAMCQLQTESESKAIESG